MNTQRLNITLPKALAHRLRAVPNRSAFIADAVRGRLDAAEGERRREELAAAYRASAKEDRTTSEEWDTSAGDAL